MLSSQPLLDALKLAEILNVSRSTAQRMMGTRIPAYTLGRCKRVRVEDVEEFMQKSLIQPHKI